MFDKQPCVYHRPAQKALNINAFFFIPSISVFFPPSWFLMTLDEERERSFPLTFVSPARSPSLALNKDQTVYFVFFFCTSLGFLQTVMKDPPASPVLSDSRHSRSAFCLTEEKLRGVLLPVRNRCITSRLSVLVLITVLPARGLFVSDRFFVCVRRKRHFWYVLLWKRLGSFSSHLGLNAAKISICHTFVRTDFL